MELKQRVRVVAIIKKGGKWLMLKRATGRADVAGWFEFVNGKIGFGEQPEDAIIRVVHDATGQDTVEVRLLDVVTFTNLRDSSEVYNLFIIFEIALPKDARVELGERYSAYRWVAENETFDLNLDDATLGVAEILRNRENISSREIRLLNVNTTKNRNSPAIVYADGGSRGNPGPAAIGYYIIDKNGEELVRGGEFIGNANSRQAEYLALKKAIQKALELGLKNVEFRLDSLMVVSQMNGVYQVKNSDLWRISDEIEELLAQFDSYAFIHVPREKNVEADAEVNRALDEQWRRRR
ncbi:MAG: reverse transcriptase-like protein [Candidatus Nomurabacteria bacterium]|nr:reverse transcriptase-like protein [Candidatus Nomurabacteria bacterium]